MKAETFSTRRNPGALPARTSPTNAPSPTAALPKAVADMPVSRRKASISARNDCAVTTIAVTGYRIFPAMQEETSHSLWIEEVPYSSGMDEVRRTILEFSQQRGQSLAKLSRAIGRNPTYLQQFITKGSPVKLEEEDRAKLAALMEIDETSLGKPLTQAQPRIQRNARVIGPVAMTTLIPAYGHAVGGKDGQFILNGNKIADVIAPPSLAGVPDAYAVYVVGDSMEPRYQPGELVYVNPRLPVKRGDYVVAQIMGADEAQPEAYIKRFVNRSGERLRLEQFNPTKVIEFPYKRVVSIHRIIMGGEG